MIGYSSFQIKTYLKLKKRINELFNSRVSYIHIHGAYNIDYYL